MSNVVDKRYKEAVRLRKFHELREYPQARAEAIARHYVAHANVALQMLHLIEFLKGKHNNDGSEILSRMVRDIVERHETDLGIKLDWDDSPPQDREWNQEFRGFPVSTPKKNDPY